MGLWDAPTKCGSWKRFKGTRDPKCLGGTGCTMCWRKRLEVQLGGLKPVVLTVAEMEALGAKIQRRLEEAGLARKSKSFQTTGVDDHGCWCRCRRCE